MKVVRRYELPGWDEFFFVVPKGSTILRIKNLHHRPFLYVKVDPAAPTVKRKFKVSMSRDNPPEYSLYVGPIPWSAHEGHLFTDEKEYV